MPKFMLHQCCLSAHLQAESSFALVSGVSYMDSVSVRDKGHANVYNDACSSSVCCLGILHQSYLTIIAGMVTYPTFGHWVLV